MQCLHLIEKGYCNLEWLKKSKQKNVMLDNGLAICHPLLSSHKNYDFVLLSVSRFASVGCDE